MKTSPFDSIRVIGNSPMTVNVPAVNPNYVLGRELLTEMSNFDPIQVAISKAVTDTASSIDAYLLSFFGSEESIKEFGKYYVLETEDAEFDTTPASENSFQVSMTTKYRLRLKTKEELADS